MSAAGLGGQSGVNKFGGTKLFQSPPSSSSTSSTFSSSASASTTVAPSAQLFPSSQAKSGIGGSNSGDSSQRGNPSQTIALRGSAETIVEFFHYCVNSILYQRGPCLYPPESYKRVSKYGLTMHLTTDTDLMAYLASILRQLEAWLIQGSAKKLVLAIIGLESDQTLERWIFDCECVSSTKFQPSGAPAPKEITPEISAIMRQITSSMTFLPILDEPCSFDILIYTDPSVDVPAAWVLSDPSYVSNSEEFKMRSFSNNVHNVDVKVSYKTNSL